MLTDRWFLIALGMAAIGVVLLALHVPFAAFGAFVAAIALVLIAVLGSQVSGR
jgi:hypothetical protein